MSTLHILITLDDEVMIDALSEDQPAEELHDVVHQLAYFLSGGVTEDTQVCPIPGANQD